MAEPQIDPRRFDCEKLFTTPSAMMACYAVGTSGHCMGQMIPGGTELIADPQADIRPLDLCVVIFKDEARVDGPWMGALRRHGESIGGITKIFLGHYDAPGVGLVFMVAEIDPPQVALIPRDAIEVMHAIVDAPLNAPTEAELVALDILHPFVNSGPVRPINPEWQPPS